VDSSVKSDYWKGVERGSRTKWVIGIGSTIALLLLIALMTWLRPGVPKSVKILAGVEGSHSHRIAESYAKFAEGHGVRAEVVATAGSGEILSRFAGDHIPTLGFLQSGVEREVGDGTAPETLQSLGSLYFEPIWLFVRNDSGIHDIPDLEGKRVFPGRPGSDARSAARSLLRAYGLAGEPILSDIEQLTPSQAVETLLAGGLDAVVVAGDTANGLVLQLLAEDTVRPIAARHAEVFTRIHPDFANILIPQGLFSLSQMLPREDVRVVAPAINLVADESLHPALVDLFLDAATTIHGGATKLSKRGEFPSEDYTSLPLNADAKEYYKKGPSGLRRYLPFWLASLVDQLIVLGLPIFVVLSSVFKGLPVALEWKTKIDLAKVYRRIQAVENAADQASRRDEYLRVLDAAEAECDALHVPRMHLSQYFELRQYIHDLRKRVERA
jgi:TRAP-type uncharacterized transport system substrate-binding protein